MSHTVLLVDDESNFLNSLKVSLRGENYSIRCCLSAKEGLNILYSEPIDLVVSDYKMPGLTGTQFLTRANLEFPDTIRILLTGKADLDVAIEAINEAHISHLILKPCNIEYLKNVIRQSLQQKDLLTQSKLLLRRFREQNSIIDNLEKEHPGITKVRRDVEGTIVVEDEDVPDDVGEFLESIKAALKGNDGSL